MVKLFLPQASVSNISNGICLFWHLQAVSNFYEEYFQYVSGNCIKIRIEPAQILLTIKIEIIFLWAKPGLFFTYFHLFLSKVQKNSATGMIQTRIFVVEGENTDHYTTTTAQSHYRDYLLYISAS